MGKIFLSVFLLLFTTACSTQQFRVSEMPAKSFPKNESSQTFYVYGIGQTADINASQVCNGEYKAGEISTTSSALDVVIGIVQSTLIGIQVYSPRTAIVACK